MSGRSSRFSPASEPLFDPAPNRADRRIRQQAGGGGGGGSEWPFQFSWPGLINYTDESPGILSFAGTSLSIWYASLIVNTSALSVNVRVNGVTAQTLSISGNGGGALSVSVPPGALVSLDVASFGGGASRGMWIGLA